MNHSCSPILESRAPALELRYVVYYIVAPWASCSLFKCHVRSSGQILSSLLLIIFFLLLKWTPHSSCSSEPMLVLYSEMYNQLLIPKIPALLSSVEQLQGLYSWSLKRELASEHEGFTVVTSYHSSLSGDSHRKVWISGACLHVYNSSPSPSSCWNMFIHYSVKMLSNCAFTSLTMMCMRQSSTSSN